MCFNNEYCVLQICQRDQDYDSYVEMPIVCQSETTNFTLIEAVAVVKPGRDLALALGTDGDVMVGSFRSADGARSALCLYKMSDIRSRIADNQRFCYNNSDVFVGQQFLLPGRTLPNCMKVPVSDNETLILISTSYRGDCVCAVSINYRIILCKQILFPGLCLNISPLVRPAAEVD